MTYNCCSSNVKNGCCKYVGGKPKVVVKFIKKIKEDIVKSESP